MAVEVSDDGAGVPADQLPRIFYRFYRAGLTSRRPGSGLGLAIAAAVAAALGEPHGLRITLILPAGSPHASRAADDADGQAGAAAEETTSLARTCRVARTDQDILEDRHVIQALAAKEIPSPASQIIPANHTATETTRACGLNHCSTTHGDLGQPLPALATG